MTLAAAHGWPFPAAAEGKGSFAVPVPFAGVGGAVVGFAYAAVGVLPGGQGLVGTGHPATNHWVVQ